MSLSCTVFEILSLISQNLKRSLPGTVCHNYNKKTKKTKKKQKKKKKKFEVFISTHYDDMKGNINIENGMVSGI